MFDDFISATPNMSTNGKIKPIEQQLQIANNH
jgi:hypothetical protein